jgi:hypothetical protein
MTTKLCYEQGSSPGAQCLSGQFSLDRHRRLSFLQLPINSHVILPALLCVKAPGTEKKKYFLAYCPLLEGMSEIVRACR